MFLLHFLGYKMCQIFMCALSLSYQAAESFLQQFHSFLFILGIDKNNIGFSSVAKLFALLTTPSLLSQLLLKVLFYFCLKCGQSAAAAAPTCHLYFFIIFLDDL